MKKETMKYCLICSICFVLFVLIAIYSSANKSTDMIMPSVYIVEGMTSWYVMLLCLLAETVLAKWFLKETYLKAASIAFIMNLVSTVLGFVALHIVGLIVELLFIPFGSATFHVSHWIVNFLLIILMNASLEGLTVKISFKLRFKEIFLWLCLSNAISMVICILFNLSWIPDMYFT